ncbi:flagellar hook-basal body complex protein [Hydrogenimonas urashimensis]|uniref:flagellar hook-basal body complex protein n=1 Tax=Hydrogenimonas urashimensis TaxID=2740515 RepID=UPI001914E0F2|nr:flagellar hook-basal body complex protein [Hydrogenimonas urashimensis]
MMRSLWAGVSGLQAHQIAMDVEGNNIANVNTTGFKYSRVNFADMLSQTSKIATAPQGELGGKNPMQVGLGTQVGSITKIFKQGSVQTTDKNTDLAIQGDGFFVISPDGGKTYKYSRNGDFVFDAEGNFVDNNGYIVQGWIRDPATNEIDATAPIQNITIPPGLTTPANATSMVSLKANLNSGQQIENKSLVFSLDSSGQNDSEEARAIENAGKSYYLDFKTLFNGTGESLAMQEGDAFRISFDGGASFTEFVYDDPSNTTTPANGTPFTTNEDLRSAMQSAAGAGTTVTLNENGKFEVFNNTGGEIRIVVEGPDTAATGNKLNQKFLDMFTPLEGAIPDGDSKISQSFYSATHASSIDIFDSLGTKHTLRFEFRKISQNTNGSEWMMVLSVPEPSEINTTDPKNYLVGSISFNSDGSLSTFSPTNISFTGNNGSAPKQTVNLELGTAGLFDGMTSFDNPSSTSGISQDGYPGGDLNGIRVDETGTLIGSFTNGRSFGLAQVAMASFANNEGLEADGGNVFIQTSNSGDPIIGQAATGKRGFISASSLEMSNVDLSRSLTNLIVIQRGFQANSKSITTSDQMLQTLLQLKQ